MYGCGEIALLRYENDIDRLYREQQQRLIKRLSAAELEQLTDKELEDLIYEYTHEINDKRTRDKLINERNRRHEWRQ